MLQCKRDFCVLLKGLRGFFQSVGRDTTLENHWHSAFVGSCASGTLRIDFLGPRYIFPGIFTIPCLALIPSKISKLPVGTSVFCCITYDDRTDDNVFKIPCNYILDRPLVFKSILQILQESLGTMLVSSF